MQYDAVLMVTFGGPNRMEEVMPFLENVLDGKDVPRERMVEVAHHYELFGGKSPINDWNNELKRLLDQRMQRHEPRLPVYIGNRNWHPFLADTLREMKEDGVRRALAFVPSAYSSYTGCRRYREDIERARLEVGEGAPVVDKIRVFYNHPLFIRANADHVQSAFNTFSATERDAALLIFTAHSIPVDMASRCRYGKQLQESSRLVAETAGIKRWELAYQSRSGPPRQAWLEPDIGDAIRVQARKGVKGLVIAPIGFTSDHIEVRYDLDTEAKALCDSLGVHMARAMAAGAHPLFVEMAHDLVAERIEDRLVRPAVGRHEAAPDVCPTTCCLPG